MIEYAAAFFGLAYLFWVIRWALNPGYLSFALSLVFGILASLAKITSFVVPFSVTAMLFGLHVLRVLWPGSPRQTR